MAPPTREYRCTPNYHSARHQMSSLLGLCKGGVGPQPRPWCEKTMV
ncbi:putative nucleic acid-binding protein [Lolium latent virus]|uniref:Uncharacterized ORF6 protein n=1 Tax=Lolium latent virus (isolate Lolium/USA/US1/-) TaxID=686945 RepID=ORF6_LOLV|nr:putative nucleic acid-binding protein [Lolium latent virus]B1PS81.1 RecName: Full=Uncharacterized ORF6 protein [Lolium latent virus USA/US1]ACA53379.1 putative nucleic acid-binding protein [Lolium latent virus]